MKTHVLFCALGLSISCSSEMPANYTVQPKAAADSKKSPASGDSEDKSTSGKTDTKTEEKDKPSDSVDEKDDEITKEKDDDEMNKEAEDKAAEMKKAEEEKALLKKVTEAFSFRWEFPCDADPGKSDQCNSKAAVNVVRTLPASADKKFEVELEFKGIVEGMMYKNGKLQGDYFYTGGEPNNGTYNIYSIKVSNPPQIYYLNTQSQVRHLTFLIDYSAKIKVNAGATIELVGDGQNGIEISNFKKLIPPGVMPETFYNGQFIEMKVKNLVELK